MTGSLADMRLGALKDRSLMLALLGPPNGGVGRKGAEETFHCSTARSKRNVCLHSKIMSPPLK